MDIWFAANIPSGSGGGVARSMQGLAEGLRKLGHRTVIVTNAPRKEGGYLFFALKLAMRLFLNSFRPPDWIIARSTDGAGCALLVKALALKTRIAIHNHGWEEYAYELERRLPRRIVYPRTTWKARIVRFPLLSACLALCSCCMCGTVSEIRWLKKKYPRSIRKFYYIPNGVQAGEKGFWMDRCDIPMHFLAVGGLTWKKNLYHTIAVFEEIARHLPRPRLFLIGTGMEKNRLPMQLHEDITVVSDVKPGEMFRWYTTCPYVISSSRYEGGHSFALLEAMSYACVVFASAIASSMEIIRNRHNGIVITGIDVQSDAAAVAAVLKEKELFAAMRHHAFSSAMRNRWERQVTRMERVLCTIK
jgi:glycosyltransferase involved in cell wall biosynthesis